MFEFQMVAEQWNLLFILYSVFIVWFGTRVMTDFFEIVRIREAMLRDRIVRVPQLGHQLRHFANASSAHFKALCNLRDEEQPPTPVPTVLVPFSLAKGVPELLIFGTQNEPDKRRSSGSSSSSSSRSDPNVSLTVRFKFTSLVPCTVQLIFGLRRSALLPGGLDSGGDDDKDDDKDDSGCAPSHEGGGGGRGSSDQDSRARSRKWTWRRRGQIGRREQRRSELADGDGIELAELGKARVGDKMGDGHCDLRNDDSIGVQLQQSGRRLLQRKRKSAHYAAVAVDAEYDNEKKEQGCDGDNYEEQEEEEEEEEEEEGEKVRRREGGACLKKHVEKTSRTGTVPLASASSSFSFSSSSS
jgi:hypothetical protein